MARNRKIAMQAGEGKIQREIIMWLSLSNNGHDAVEITQGIFGILNRKDITKSQRVTVRRALGRLKALGVVQLCEYRSRNGYLCWGLKVRHPDLFEEPKRGRMSKGFKPKIIER
jgi:hypothetical protein